MIRHANDDVPGHAALAAVQDDRFRRDFLRILGASADYFMRVTTDEANHLADGIFSNLTGEGYKAFFSYDREHGVVELAIVFSGVRFSQLEQFRTLLRIQAATRLARFDPDEEDNVLRLTAASVCPDPGKAKPVMRQMCESLRSALTDSRLQGLL